MSYKDCVRSFYIPINVQDLPNNTFALMCASVSVNSGMQTFWHPSAHPIPRNQPTALALLAGVRNSPWLQGGQEPAQRKRFHPTNFANEFLGPLSFSEIKINLSRCLPIDGYARVFGWGDMVSDTSAIS